MVTYTTTNLLSEIKLVAHVPQGNSTFTEADFLSLADMEMRTGIAPKISACRENYWLTTNEQPLNGDNEYPIPSKAIGGSFVDVKVKSGVNLIHLGRLEVSELYSTQYSTRPSYSYYLEDNLIRLVPTTLSGNVIIWYYRIPSEIVPVVECAQITEINDAALTVDNVPSTFVNQELDIVSQQPGFNVLLKDDEPVSIIGDVITFSEVSSRVTVGDYICLSGQSCVIQCPLEWIEVLVQRVAVKIYEIQGYDRKHELAMKVLEGMEMRAMGLVSPRTIENPKIIGGGGSLLNPQNMGWKLPVRN